MKLKNKLMNVYHNLKNNLRKANFRNASIRYKIPLFLLIFVSAMLFILWLSEVVFIEDIYQSIKSDSIHKAGNEIVKEVDKKHIDKLVQKVSRDHGACVSVTDVYGNILYKGDFNNSCKSSISLSEFTTRIAEAVNHDSTYLEKVTREETYISEITPNFDIRMATRVIKEIKFTGISVKKDQTYVIFVDATISPLSETLLVIRKVIMFVTLIMTLFAILLGIIISKFITKPILLINEQSKQLLNSHYHPEEIRGYKEVNELSKTLNQTAIELQQVETLRNELIANISHDLRTPLTMIGGYAEMMSDLPDENTPENLKVILDETRHLTRLVNDVLDLSKLRSHEPTLTLTQFSLTDLIIKVCERLNVLNNISDVKIRFEYQANISIEADELKISQVLYNLLSNAINYSKEQSEVILRQTKKNQQVLIEVIDFGEGIEESELSTIWERYYRTNNDHVRKKVGSGLGLSIVKEVLEVHHANYGVTSKLHEGSTFYFSLPYLT